MKINSMNVALKKNKRTTDSVLTNLKKKNKKK